MENFGHTVQDALATFNIPEFQHNAKVPTEILDTVWPRLTSTEKGLARQVCKSFKKHIDDKLGCEVCIDDREFRNLRCVSPPASTLRVINLSPIYNIQMLLGHPLMVSTLSLEGNIDPENLIQLLKLCKKIKTLQVLASYNLTTMSMPYNFEDPQEIKLRKLQNLIIQGDFQRGNREESPWQNIEYLLRRIIAPDLETFHLQNFFDCPKEYEKSVDFLGQFIVKHCQTLNHLKLTLRKGQYCDHLNVQHDAFGRKSLELKVEDEDLEALDLETFAINCDKPYHQLTDKILMNSHSLSTLEYDKPWASWILYSSIILLNSGSLNSLKIANVEPILDMSSLGSCHNLKILHLTKEQVSAESKTTPNIINFEMLPSSIEEIQIKNYSVDSLSLLSVAKFQSLRSVVFQFLSTRSNPETGATASFIFTLLTRHRKLDEIFIEEFNTHDTQLDFITILVEDINMVPRSNRFWRHGIRRWILAIASDKTLKEWKQKFHLFEISTANVFERKLL